MTNRVLTASALVEGLRQDLAPVEQRLFAHPYVAAAEAGRLSRSDLLVFASQQYRIILSDLRSVALFVHRTGGTPVGPFFAAGLKTETSALARLAAFGRAVGAPDVAALSAVEPLPGALAYTHFVA